MRACGPDRWVRGSAGTPNDGAAFRFRKDSPCMRHCNRKITGASPQVKEHLCSERRKDVVWLDPTFSFRRPSGDALRQRAWNVSVDENILDSIARLGLACGSFSPRRVYASLATHLACPCELDLISVPRSGATAAAARSSIRKGRRARLRARLPVRSTWNESSPATALIFLWS